MATTCREVRAACVTPACSHCWQTHRQRLPCGARCTRLLQPVCSTVQLHHTCCLSYMYFTIRSSSCQCVNPEQRWARAEGATSAHRLRTCLTTRYRTLVSPRTVAALLALHGAAVSGVPPARSVASGSATLHDCST